MAKNQLSDVSDEVRAGLEKLKRFEKVLADFESGKLRYHGTNDQDLMRVFTKFQECPSPEQEKIVCESAQDYLLCQIIQGEGYTHERLTFFKYYEAYQEGLNVIPNQSRGLRSIVERAKAVEIRDCSV